ncbi:MAG: DUF4194 domain-containing protein [Peptococcaceae bacterium]|nr:DUF4194 domain-containing protein [Peptococcaceae bacterium]
MRKKEVCDVLEGVSETERPKLIEAINRLLAVNYLARELDRERYLLFRRHREAVNRFFGELGWEFILDERHECLVAVSPESMHHRNLSKEESIWFLILRLIYQEKRQSLSLSQFPMTTVYEIRAKYETFRLPFVNRTRLLELVRLCKQFHLLEPLDKDFRDSDCRFRLFHTWLYAVTGEDITKLQEKLQGYGETEGGGAFNEMDEEIEVD